jgi:hypothetical protein
MVLHKTPLVARRMAAINSTAGRLARQTTMEPMARLISAVAVPTVIYSSCLVGAEEVLVILEVVAVGLKDLVQEDQALAMGNILCQAVTQQFLALAKAMVLSRSLGHQLNSSATTLLCACKANAHGFASRSRIHWSHACLHRGADSRLDAPKSSALLTIALFVYLPFVFDCLGKAE